MSENGAGGEEGGNDDCELRRLGVGRGAGDEAGAGEPDLWRFEPRGV